MNDLRVLPGVGGSSKRQWRARVSRLRYMPAAVQPAVRERPPGSAVPPSRPGVAFEGPRYRTAASLFFSRVGRERPARVSGGGPAPCRSRHEASAVTGDWSLAAARLLGKTRDGTEAQPHRKTSPAERLSPDD